MEGVTADFGFGEEEDSTTGSGDVPPPVAGLPRHAMLAVVLAAAVLNFAEIILNQTTNQYDRVDETLSADTTFNVVCAVFALGAGLYGALARNRSGMLLSFVFSCTTAAALRFDERRVDADYEAFRVIVVLFNLVAAWTSMITSEQTQREAKAAGKATTWLLAADTLDRFVVPALAVAQLTCGVAGLILSRNAYVFEASQLAPRNGLDQKVTTTISVGTGILFSWNIVTAVFGFLSITAVGDKAGRGMLVLVASSALTGISIGFQFLRFFPSAIQYWGILCDCPILGQNFGLDTCAEKTQFKAMMVIMYISWLCNAGQAWSAWALSESREDQGGAGGLREGGDESMSNSMAFYSRWNTRAAVLQFGLALTCFYRFLSLRTSEETYPDSINLAIEGTAFEDQEAYYANDWSDGLIEARYQALILALVTFSSCFFVMGGQNGKYRDMLLTAGALAAFLCTTIALNAMMTNLNEVKYGYTIPAHNKPLNNLRNLTRTTEECKEIETPPAYAEIQPMLAPFGLDNEDFEYVYSMSHLDRVQWGLYCEPGLAAFMAFVADNNDLVSLGIASGAAVACHDASPAVALQYGFGDGTEGFYVPPHTMPYPKGTESQYEANLVLTSAIFGVAIVQVFLTLAMSEANE